MSDSIYSKAAEQNSAYHTDLVTSHGCAYIGTGTESNGDLFDLYHDPDTGLIFKVVSDHNIDSVVYEPR